MLNIVVASAEQKKISESPIRIEPSFQRAFLLPVGCSSTTELQRTWGEIGNVYMYEIHE